LSGYGEDRGGAAEEIGVLGSLVLSGFPGGPLVRP